MVPRWLLHLCLCCLLLGAVAPSAVGPSAAAPPPRPLCDACGDTFERTAEAHGVALTVERSTATVAIHENGSATWVVRNRLADSAAVERFRSNASLRTEIADGAMWDTEFLGANVSADGVLTMRYRDPDFARPSVGGTLRSGEFTREYGYRNLDGLGADRLVVVAPEGTQVGWTVSGATVSDDGRRVTLTRLDEFGFVTFVPSDALLGSLWSTLAVGSLVGPAVVTNALVYVALPTALFAVLIAAAVSRRWLDAVVERARDVPGGALIGVGALVALGLLAGGVSLLGGAIAPFFGVGFALASLGAVFSLSTVRERASYRTLVAGAALGGLLAASATVVGAVAFGGSGPARSLFFGLPFLLPLFALLPAGYAAGRENRRLAVGTAAAGFALAMIPSTPFTAPSLGPGFVVIVFIVAAYAAAIAVVGVPLLAAGASLVPARTD